MFGRHPVLGPFVISKYSIIRENIGFFQVLYLKIKRVEIYEYKKDE